MNVTLPTTDQGRFQAIDRLTKVLRALDSEKAWEVTVSEKKRRRSEQQNRYLWGVCYAEILKHLPGWDAEDVHEYFLGEHFGWEVLEGFGKKRMKPIRRSSRLNKMEFADYVNFIQRKAADMGIYIPDAEL
jgi:hypothetical protein